MFNVTHGKHISLWELEKSRKIALEKYCLVWCLGLKPFSSLSHLFVFPVSTNLLLLNVLQIWKVHSCMWQLKGGISMDSECHDFM